MGVLVRLKSMTDHIKDLEWVQNVVFYLLPLAM